MRKNLEIIDFSKRDQKLKIKFLGLSINRLESKKVDHQSSIKDMN